MTAGGTALTSSVVGTTIGGTTLVSSQVGSAAGSSSAHRSDDQPAFEPLGRLQLAGTAEATVEDGIAYVAVTDGIATVDVSDPADPTMLARVKDFFADHQAGPLSQIWDCWLDGDRLVAAGPANPRGDAVTGCVLLDVSDPRDPVVVDEHETEFPIHNTFFEDGIVYLTGNGAPGEPVVMYDATGRRLEAVGRWSLFDHNPDWESVHPRLRTLHDITVHDGIAYLSYWDAGTYLVDVSDPASPEYRSHVTDYEPDDLADLEGREAALESLRPPGNHHNAALGDDGDLLVIGKESWANEEDDGTTVGGPSGLVLWDVSDPTQPSQLGTIAPPETYDATQSGWFTTAHNCEVVGDRLYTSWYFGGVKLFDISDPTSPEELAWWRNPPDGSFWTAQAGVPGEYFVAASSAAGGGDSALYTFPDRAGQQQDAPSLREPPGSDDGSTSDDDSGGDDGSTNDDDAGGDDGSTSDDGSEDDGGSTNDDSDGSDQTTDDSGGEADTDESGQQDEGTATEGDETESAGGNTTEQTGGSSADGTPGFGVLTATVGIAGGALAVLRRRTADDSQ